MRQQRDSSTYRAALRSARRPQQPSTQRLVAGVVATLLAFGACSSGASRGQATSPNAAREAIRSVLARDSELGRMRNHAPESAPVAEAVETYVRELATIDFEGCPPDFEAAFARHRTAWRDSIDFLAGFDELRGEMHDLFDAIRARGGSDRAELEDLERAIWSTWADVEAAAQRHGAGA